MMLLKDAECNERREVVTLPDGTLVLCMNVPGGPLRAFDRNHQEPSIPRRPTKVIGGATALEEDLTDPEYLAEMAEFEEKRAQDFMELAWDFMQVLDKDEREQAERERLMSRWGLAGSKYDYLDCYVLVGSDEEIAEKVKMLTTSIMSLSTITKGGLEEAKDSFPSDVDGDAGDPAGPPKEPPELREEETVPVS